MLNTKKVVKNIIGIDKHSRNIVMQSKGKCPYCGVPFERYKDDSGMSAWQCPNCNYQP